MPLTKCKECGHTVSTEAPACPQCGTPPRSAGGGSGTTVVVLVIIGAVLWYFLAPSGSVQRLTQSVSESGTASSSKNKAFPAGTYKFVRDTYITLNPDGTFEVKSNLELLWRCNGTWTFANDTLNMRANADDQRKQFLPWIFWSPAKLVSRGDNVIVWECVNKMIEWKRIDQ